MHTFIIVCSIARCSCFDMHNLLNARHVFADWDVLGHQVSEKLSENLFKGLLSQSNEGPSSSVSLLALMTDASLKKRRDALVARHAKLQEAWDEIRRAKNAAACC